MLFLACGVIFWVAMQRYSTFFFFMELLYCEKGIVGLPRSMVALASRRYLAVRMDADLTSELRLGLCFGLKHTAPFDASAKKKGHICTILLYLFFNLMVIVAT